MGWRFLGCFWVGFGVLGSWFSLREDLVGADRVGSRGGVRNQRVARTVLVDVLGSFLLRR